jgi:hypothetical protein
VCVGVMRQDGARLTLATSHFAELKAMAQTDERFVTSAVEFDTVALKPTYKLLWGEVGYCVVRAHEGRAAKARAADGEVHLSATLSLTQVGNSNALAIAAGLGLPPTILKASKEIMATELSLSAAGERLKTGALMQSLFAQAEQQRMRTQRRVEEVQAVEASVEAMRAEILRLERDADQLRAEYRAEAAAARDAAVAAMEAALTTVSVMRHTTFIYLLSNGRKERQRGIHGEIDQGTKFRWLIKMLCWRGAIVPLQEGADDGASKEERLRRIDAAVKAFSTDMDVAPSPVQDDDGETWQPSVGSTVHVKRLGKIAVASVIAVSTTATGVRVTGECKRRDSHPVDCSCMGRLPS